MKTMLTTLAGIIAAGLLAVPAGLRSQDAHDHHDHSTPETTATDDKRVGDAWPLDTCVVSGMKLDSMGEPIVRIHEGREVRFCCAGCLNPFNADPTAHLAKADAKIIEQQKANYPLDYCIVDTPEKLSDDESKNSYHVIGNRLFIFCCPPCEKQVKADPDTYFRTLNKAVSESQRASYPTDTCVVSGDKLGGEMGEIVEYVHNGELFLFCCKGCISMFEKNPQPFVEKLHALKSGAAAAAPSTGEAHQRDDDGDAHRHH